MTASHRIVPVILSGGIGARLWPASRRLQPKQLLALVENRSMIRVTIERAASLESVAPAIIVTGGDHADAIQRELVRATQPGATLIVEPMGRNTAPAVAVAAHEAMADGSDPLLLILPSDHTIADQEAFAEAVRHGAGAAASGYLVTFGVTATRPETGYGYIRRGAPIADHVLAVDEFREKPDVDTAARYVESGMYLWNSGMFLFKASTYLGELSDRDGTMASLARSAWERAKRDGHRLILDGGTFEQIEASSIDYTVMERTSMAAVVATDPGWNDVGSWASLWDIAERDPEGNAISGDVVAVDVLNSYIRGTDKLVAAVGLKDVIIVDTPDALLVTTRDNAQNVKQIVDSLKAANRPEFESDGTVYQPWGGVRVIASGPGFRALHLWLDPGEKTSIEVNEEKSEHWSVLRGVARITIDGATSVVAERESVYIPQGIAHMLENEGDEVLEVIELEIDLCMSETDIARFLNGHGEAEQRR